MSLLVIEVGNIMKGAGSLQFSVVLTKVASGKSGLKGSCNLTNVQIFGRSAGTGGSCQT